eukprot:7408211-Lingulodinium_polyedra.AAC.1
MPPAPLASRPPELKRRPRADPAREPKGRRCPRPSNQMQQQPEQNNSHSLLNSRGTFRGGSMAFLNS